MARSKKRPGKSKARKRHAFPLKAAALSLLFLLLPLLFSRATQDPMTPVRWLALSVFLSTFLVVFLLWRREQLLFKKHPKELKVYLLVSLGFLLWGTVSAYTSINTSTSVQELLRLATIPVLTYVTYHTVISDRDYTHWLYRAIALAAGIQGLVALGQGWGLESMLSIPGRGGKIYGLMANGNLLGSAQVVSIPFIWLATLDVDRRWTTIAKIAMTLAISSVVIAASRSPWVAMIPATLPLIITLYLKRQKFAAYLTTIRSSGWIYALASLLLVSSVILTNDRVSKSVLSRVAPTSTGIADDKIAIQAKENISSRLTMWKVAASKVGDHPLIGIGPANWKIMSPLYEAEHDLGTTSGAKNLRPHNVYLQIANEYGIPGLLLFLTMGVIPTILCAREIIKTNAKKALPIAAMLGVFGVLATDFMFSFSHERVLHMSILALATGITFKFLTNEKQVKESSVQQSIVWGIISALCLFSAYTATERWKFEHQWLKAKAYLDAGNNEQSLLEAEKGNSSLVKIGPIANTMEVNTAQALKNLGRLDEAVSASHLGLKQHPYNFALINNLGTIYFQAKQYDSASHYFNRALELHPADPLVIKNLATTSFNAGQYDQCIEYIDSLTAKDLDSQINSLRQEAIRRSK